MKLGKIIIHAQYEYINRGFTSGLIKWIGLLSGQGLRNYTSSGKQWWSWYSLTRRLNIWPYSIWFQGKT